jgi:hypothetical protein
MKGMNTRTYTVTGSPLLLDKLEALLAQMSYNCHIGHSSYFGMFVDGDGADVIDVDEIDTRSYPRLRGVSPRDFEYPYISWEGDIVFGSKFFR